MQMSSNTFSLPFIISLYRYKLIHQEKELPITTMYQAVHAVYKEEQAMILVLKSPSTEPRSI
jgi:hypothetical protein